MLSRWVGVPSAVRVVVGALVLVLGYGGIVHIVQLILADGHPYVWAPTWLAVYFTSLTGLDPLAAILLAARRAVGLYLATAVLVTDALANGYALWVLAGGNPLGPAIIGVLAVATVASIPFVRPWLHPVKIRTIMM